MYAVKGLTVALTDTACQSCNCEAAENWGNTNDWQGLDASLVFPDPRWAVHLARTGTHQNLVQTKNQVHGKCTVALVLVYAGGLQCSTPNP